MFEREAPNTERGSPSLVGRGIANPQEDLLASDSRSSFEDYLKSQKKRNYKHILCYAKKYCTVLQTGDASPLVSLSSAATRRHAMEALTALSKYCGKYSVWKDICVKYQLRWGNSNEDNLRYFTNYLHGNGNLDVMISWLKDALQRLPQPVGNVLLYNTLTGLRFQEGVLSINLIQTDLEHYANKELGVLENFRYPEFISKKTKKSFLTVYDDSVLQVAQGARLVKSWEAIRKQLNRCGLKSHTKYCRAIYATYLRKCGVEQEIIDLYQGRVPTSIFRAHYLKTNVKEDRERI
jgi:Archaeal phage integrase